MQMKNIKNSDDAVVGIVVTVLLIGLMISSIIMVRTEYVPQWIEEKEDSSDRRVLCGRGINVATLEWCQRNKTRKDIIVEVEFYVKDILAIPYATDGKFRVKRMKIVKEVKTNEV